MNTTPRLKKAISRMPRTLAVTTAVGIACAAGLATAAPAMAAPTTHAAVQAAPPAAGRTSSAATDCSSC
ncbi:hypothetical protein ACE6JH_33370 [Streptomyces nigra]